MRSRHDPIEPSRISPEAAATMPLSLLRWAQTMHNGLEAKGGSVMSGLVRWVVAGAAVLLGTAAVFPAADAAVTPGRQVPLGNPSRPPLPLPPPGPAYAWAPGPRAAPRPA